MAELAEYGLGIHRDDLNFADICQFSEKDLLRIHEFGKKSLEELRAKLSESGWRLAEWSHTPEELNGRFRSNGAPSWWCWEVRSYRSSTSEDYAEFLKRCAAEAAQPKFAIPTDPEAYAEWLRTGKGLILCQT